MPSSIGRKYSFKYPPDIHQTWTRSFHPANRRQEGVTLAEKGCRAHRPMLSSIPLEGREVWGAGRGRWCSEEREGRVICPERVKLEKIFFLI